MTGDNKRGFQKGEKVLVIDGSEEERTKAISRLQSEGVEVVSREEAIKIISDSLDVDVSGLLQEIVVTVGRSVEEAIIDIEKKPKKKKGKDAKFGRQPWQ